MSSTIFKSVPELGFKGFEGDKLSGWYKLAGKPEVVMTFASFGLVGGKVTGKGKDSVGNFTFTGSYKDDSSVTFVKKYPAHTVTYTGNLAKEEEYYITGKFVVNKGGKTSGTFRLDLVSENMKIQKEIDAVLAGAEITFVDFKADVKDAGATTVKAVAKVLAKYPDVAIICEGHTKCGNGKGCAGDCTNAKLAGDRISNVVRMMTENGCKNKFEVKGWGCKHPEVKAKKAVRISPNYELMARQQKIQEEINAVLAGAEISFVDFKADVKAAGAVTVKAVAKVLAKYPDVDILCEGHTKCGAGKGCAGDCKNAKLASERIENVVKMMTTNGCKNKFEVKGWGCKHPEIKAEKAVRISAV